MGWIKCSERMPPKNKTVLFWYNGDYEFGMAIHGESSITIYNDGWDCTAVDAISNDISWMSITPPQD